MESIVHGYVIEGEQEGTRIGFPTANLNTPSGNIEPSYGIYAGFVHIKHKQGSHQCAVIIRERNNEKHIEVHILDFNENIYGQELVVTIKALVRPWQEFEDVAKLQEQIEKDLVKVRELLAF